jgi:hypothetical protein
MLLKLQYFCCAVICLLAIAGMEATATAGDILYDWQRYRLGDPQEWGNYFRASAKIHLGAEQRLPNGVSWRMLTDLSSGVAMPRLTWMPDGKRLLTANRLLDIVQGGEMLIEKEEWRTVETENEFRAQWGVPPSPFNHGLGQRVTLAYAGPRLMSLFESLVSRSSGTHPLRLMRGLAFDLEKGTMAHVSACSGADAYGFANDDHSPADFLFQYGELLTLCDQTTYRKFIELLQSIDSVTARHISASEPNKSKGCVEQSGRPVFREKQEYVLYLTFTGLAVRASGPDCPEPDTPDNPVIVPYRQLEPFMRPGPWKDELLGLR